MVNPYVNIFQNHRDRLMRKIGQGLIKIEKIQRLIDVPKINS